MVSEMDKALAQRSFAVPTTAWHREIVLAGSETQFRAARTR